MLAFTELETMITLHKHYISANIKDRYATLKYAFDFENEQSSYAKELNFEVTIHYDAFIADIVNLSANYIL